MRTLIVILTLFLSIMSFGRSSYYKGDTLYVWSETGINLHETIDPTSKTIEVVPFGDVIIFESYGDDTDVSFELFSSKYIDEKYTKTMKLSSDCRFIKVKHNDSYGYVCHTFVSKINTKWANIDLGLLSGFLEKEYGIMKQTNTGYSTGNNTFSDYDIIYNNGVYYSSNPLTENGFTFSYSLPNTNIDEALLMIYLINNSINKESDDSGYCVIEADEKSSKFIRLQDEVIYSDLIIREAGPFIILTINVYAP